MYYIEGVQRVTTPKIFYYSRKHRLEPTPAESTFWGLLKPFRKIWYWRSQFVLRQRIVDFYCGEFKLIVELDGSSHKGCEARDSDRDAYFEQYGWNIMRMPNWLVMKYPEEAMKRLVERIIDIRRARGY